MRVCLASTSPARLMLLRQVGIEPIAIAPGVDEDAAVQAREEELNRSLLPAEHVQLLATAKARATVGLLLEQHPDFDGVLIGGDSMFALEGTVYGKPHLPDIAKARWQEMRGKTGTLHSGHTVLRIADGTVRGSAEAATSADVSFASDITDAEIDAYVATGEPLAVAGAFTVDSLGGAFITRVDGDPSTVVGMSLSKIRVLVRSLGVQWPTLWNRVDENPS